MKRQRSSLNELPRLPGPSVLRRMIAAHCPVALYYLLRIVTCVPPLVVLFTRSAPDENLHFGPPLVAYAVLLGLVVATTYTILLRSFMTEDHDGIRRPTAVIVVSIVGLMDMLGGLAAVLLSGGWGSPFWHVWFSSLVLPCLILGMGWSILIAAFYMVVCSMVTGFFADGDPAWVGPQRYLYFSSMFTILLLSGILGYLGDMCFRLQRSRVRAERALADLGTMLEITRSVAVITSNINDMMRRVARTICERHRYDTVGIYLVGPEGADVKLSGWVGNFEDLDQYARQTDHLIFQAISEERTRSVRDEESWSAAIPIRDSDVIMGVLLVASSEAGTVVPGRVGLDQTLVSQIAVGIRIARLRQRATDVRTPHEWELLTRQIHDRITGSMYSLMLSLQACAEIARLNDNPLAPRLSRLVAPTRAIFLDTRQYLYYLLPALREDAGPETVVRNLAAEFEGISGIRTDVSVSSDLPRLALPIMVGCYDMMQYRLADILHSSTATRVHLELAVSNGGIRLAISDDGVSYEDSILTGDGIEEIRASAADMGGKLEMSVTEDAGTYMVFDLSMQSGSDVLDQSAHH